MLRSSTWTTGSSKINQGEADASLSRWTPQHRERGDRLPCHLFGQHLELLPHDFGIGFLALTLDHLGSSP